MIISNEAGGRRLNIDCGAGTVGTVGKGTILDPVITTTIAPSVDNSSSSTYSSASISTTTGLLTVKHCEVKVNSAK